MAVVGVYDESRGSHILFVAPGLDVTESCKVVTIEGDDGLGLLHLCCQILVCTLGDACAPDLGGIGDGLQYGVDIFLMRGVGH